MRPVLNQLMIDLSTQSKHENNQHTHAAGPPGRATEKARRRGTRPTGNDLLCADAKSAASTSARLIQKVGFRFTEPIMLCRHLSPSVNLRPRLQRVLSQGGRELPTHERIDLRLHFPTRRPAIHRRREISRALQLHRRN